MVKAIALEYGPGISIAWDYIPTHLYQSASSGTQSFSGYRNAKRIHTQRDNLVARLLTNAGRQYIIFVRCPFNSCSSPLQQKISSLSSTPYNTLHGKR